LQKLIDKYPVSIEFEEYMSKAGKNKEKNLEAVRTCIMTPRKIDDKKYMVKS
jgi:hypothetical protein